MIRYSKLLLFWCTDLCADFLNYIVQLFHQNSSFLNFGSQTDFLGNVLDKRKGEKRGELTFIQTDPTLIQVSCYRLSILVHIQCYKDTRVSMSFSDSTLKGDFKMYTD
jgi:hypothetical protein